MGSSEQDARWERLLRKLGLSAMTLENWAVNGQEREIEVTDLRFKLDADNRTSVLCVIKAVAGGEALVGFVGATDLTTALIAVAERLKAGTVKWREDRPWVPPGER